MIDLNLEKVHRKPAKLFLLCGTTMDENQLCWKYTGLSKQQEQMKWAAGIFWMTSPSGVTFSFLYEGP